MKIYPIENTPDNSCDIALLARFNPNLEKPMGRQTNLVKGFFQAANQHNVSMLVVEPENFLNSNTVTGYRFDGKEWKTLSAKRPDVIYDRYYSSISGFDQKLVQQKKSIESSLCKPFLNPINLAETATDKLLFQKFMKNSALKCPQVVATCADNADFLWDELNHRRALILKPRFGRMGQCVIRASKHFDSVKITSGNMQWVCLSSWEFAGILKGVCEQSGITAKDLFAQQAVALPEKLNRFFDVRLLVQRRNGTDKPVISGEVARVSSSDESVPNIDCGGLAIPMDDMIQMIWDSRQAGKIIVTLRETAVSLYQELEDKFGLIAELGIDCLVDSCGSVWVIEINSKPGRIAFERLASGFGLSRKRREYFAERRRESILNPILYGAWLAKQTRKDI